MEPGFSRSAFMRSMHKWMVFWFLVMQFVLFRLGLTIAEGFSTDWRWRVFGGLVSLVPLDFYLIKLGRVYFKLADIWEEEDRLADERRRDERDIRAAEAIRARVLILEESKRQEMEQHEQARQLAEIIEDLDDRPNSQ